MLVALVAQQSGHLEREPLRLRAQRVEARASCPGVLLGGDPKAPTRRAAFRCFCRRVARGGLGCRSADWRPVPDDPNVARSGLQPVKRHVDIAWGRLSGPALADLSDLARCRQLTQAAKRLRLVQSRRFGDPPSGVLALRELAQHSPHPILSLPRARLGLGRGRLRRAGQTGLGPLSDGPCGWSVPIAGSTGGAQQHRLTALRLDNDELTPAAPGAAYRAAAPRAVNRRQVLGLRCIHPPHDRTPAEQARELSKLMTMAERIGARAGARIGEPITRLAWP